MKTIPLRQLVREPLKVKRWTRAGQTVHVTDDGKPLWTIQASEVKGDDETRKREINDLLDQGLRQPASSLSLSRIIQESRR